jgi:hypothetical protein
VSTDIGSSKADDNARFLLVTSNLTAMTLITRLIQRAIGSCSPRCSSTRWWRVSVHFTPACEVHIQVALRSSICYCYPSYHRGDLHRNNPLTRSRGYQDHGGSARLDRRLSRMHATKWGIRYTNPENSMQDGILDLLRLSTHAVVNAG